VIRFLQYEPTGYTVHFRFILKISLYMFRKVLLLIIMRQNSVCTAVGIWHVFMLTSSWQHKRMTIPIAVNTEFCSMMMSSKPVPNM